jgi:dihydrofolate reductase
MRSEISANVSMIAAIGKNLAIGKNNDLLWSLPADLAHFKRLTTGKTIIMGRKTFESIGRPLPNRTNVVVTRQPDYVASGCLMAASLEKAIENAYHTRPSEEIMIVGGGELYREGMNLSTKLYITWVDVQPDADTYFPAIDPKIWEKTDSEVRPADEKNPIQMEFCTYHKRV